MAARERTAGRTTERTTECRQCRVYCDWVVEPTSCITRGCPNLYAYDLPDGTRYLGCVQRVFATEVAHEALDRAIDEGRAFGGLKCRSAPLPICDAAVDPAYVARVPAVGCVNPEFFEPPGGGSFRVFARVDAG
jgi:hypothetical protein